jgi:hypothetical protein
MAIAKGWSLLSRLEAEEYALYKRGVQDPHPDAMRDTFVRLLVVLRRRNRVRRMLPVVGIIYKLFSSFKP